MKTALVDAGRLLTPMSEMVLAKSAQKRHQSTRKVARKVTFKGYPVYKTTVHNYLTKCLRLLEPLKPRCQPKLTEAHKIKRLPFAQERKTGPSKTGGAFC